jgi:hypothetical protein
MSILEMFLVIGFAWAIVGLIWLIEQQAKATKLLSVQLRQSQEMLQLQINAQSDLIRRTGR